MAEQYFSAEPASKDVRRTLNVTLRGHEATAQVSNGVFSGSRVDLGTSVLLKHAPEPPLTGDFLDLGCGWGPIALTLAFESPEANVWAVDVNERAVDLTHANAQANGHTNIHTAQVDESSTPLPAENQPAFCETVPSDLTFDVIWSNPPIRVGKEALHTLLMACLAEGHGVVLAAEAQGGRCRLSRSAEESRFRFADPLAGRCARRGVHCEQIRELQGLPYH